MQKTSPEIGGMGHSIKRKEDPRFIQGKGNYVDDVNLPGMVYGHMVRSPYAHARIKSINTEKAKKLPGVLAVITGEDLAKANLAWMPTLYFDKQMVLATGKVLALFADLVQGGDTVITFNYDSTVERVLLERNKWFPSDGYGERLVFQKDRYDKTVVTFSDSPVRVLHLHGAVGWYRKPSVKEGYLYPGGAIPPEAHTPAPIETRISIDRPAGLRDLSCGGCLLASTTAG